MKNKIYSYSKINSFNACPLKYKFVYIDKNYKKDESIEAFVGKIVHKSLEWIYTQKINKGRSYFSVDHLTTVYKDNWDEAWHSNIRRFKYIKRKKIEYFTSGMNYLVNYYRNFGPYFNEKVYNIEEEFSFELDDYKYKAIIDRVDMDNSKIHIIDYKTAKRPITEERLKSDLQMGIYLFAVKDRFPDIDKVKLSHYYVSLDKLVSIDSTLFDETKFRSDLTQNIKNIELSEEKDNFAPNETKLCNWCYHWNECSVKTGEHPSTFLK